MPSTDIELLDAWKSGDQDAGEQLFERHFPAVARFFRNKVTTGVDDLIQSTFLGCMEARDRFRGDSSFRTFLFAVAHNVLRHHFRKQKRIDAQLDFEQVSAVDLAPGPSSVVAKKREQRLVLQALREIPVDHQVMLELYFWEPLKAKEIAEVLEIPEGTVRTRIRRAKQLLEEKLRELAESPQELERTTSNLEDWARSIRVQVEPEEEQ